MKLGIIGLPGAGKTTLFNALTKGTTPTGQKAAGRFEVQTAIVDVPDARVEILSQIFRPKKSTYAKVTCVDIGGLPGAEEDKNALSGALLNQLAAMEGFIHVARAFPDPANPHPADSIDAGRDLATLDSEFILSDLVTVDTRLEKLKEGLGKGAIRNKGQAATESNLLEQVHETLSAERPLRDLELDQESLKTLRGFGLLTLKPVLVIVNIGDEQPEQPLVYDHRQAQVANLRGRLEAELAQLEGDDLALFMQEYGLSEQGLERVIRYSYDLLGLQSFFTVSEDEVRAWTVAKGATAVEAAAVIHTDLAKGFIRAEVVPGEQLVALGGLAEARAAGKLRLEGKTYVVQDGDVIHIKFNL